MKYLVMTKFTLTFILIFSFTLTGNSPNTLVKPDKGEQLEDLRKRNEKILSEIENQIEKYVSD